MGPALYKTNLGKKWAGIFTKLDQQKKILFYMFHDGWNWNLRYSLLAYEKYN